MYINIGLKQLKLIELSKEKLKILVVEDAPGDVFLIRFYLEELDPEYYEIYDIDNLNEAHKMISREAFDIILLDMNLPDSEGMLTLTTTIEKFPDETIIVMTGLSDEKIGVEAVKKGAQDFLVKGRLDSKALDSSIKFAYQRAELKKSVRIFKHVLTEMEKLNDFVCLYYYKTTGEIFHSINFTSYFKRDVEVDFLDDFFKYFNENSVKKIKEAILDEKSNNEVKILDKIKCLDSEDCFDFKISNSNLLKGYVVISIKRTS